MISDKLFRELEKRAFTSITKLNLSKIYSDAGFNELSNEGIDNLRYFPNLKKLSLFKNQLTKEAVAEILGSVPAGLEELDLGTFHFILGLNDIGDDSGFRKLEKLERLQTLKLAGTGITE
jgi:Leucine-rich repeat (LRR) protein